MTTLHHESLIIATVLITTFWLVALSILLSWHWDRRYRSGYAQGCEDGAAAEKMVNGKATDYWKDGWDDCEKSVVECARLDTTFPVGDREYRIVEVEVGCPSISTSADWTEKPIGSEFDSINAPKPEAKKDGRENS